MPGASGPGAALCSQGVKPGVNNTGCRIYSGLREPPYLQGPHRAEGPLIWRVHTGGRDPPLSADSHLHPPCRPAWGPPFSSVLPIQARPSFLSFLIALWGPLGPQSFSHPSLQVEAAQNPTGPAMSRSCRK